MTDLEWLTEEVADLRRRCGVGRCLYGIRFIDRDTEEQPQLATVMYSMNGPEGPWHDMVTGHPEWCEEVADALTVVEDDKQAKTGGGLA